MARPLSHRASNQTTPGPAPTLREVVRAIAKLGGFLGRKSDGEPGVKVIWRGLQMYRSVFDTYQFLM
ncbi:IS4 family transposase [Paenibacillus sabuli]|uniref:IS4 family transposase n=1 Tax=Paenibacillus sabuli TaxID=2772509 RepID=UPI0037C61FFE